MSIYSNASLNADALTSVGGDLYIYSNAVFKNKITKNKKYKSVDGKLFIIEIEKSAKGIKIYDGYNAIGIIKGKAKKEQCFVAEKDGFFAHGVTRKQAIKDCLFKIVSEKIKKAPIKKDTVIDANYYHTVTGSCIMGINSFIKQHELKESYKAGELLPILESKRAYGFEKFKQLITF